jgi:hypothetical protein
VQPSAATGPRAITVEEEVVSHSFDGSGLELDQPFDHLRFPLVVGPAR